ncbi:hypothetical protein [Cryptosporangium aurantiacum]|uniref:Mycothiol synthase n=1 Tax=Cryptosporangium aurantiacum TaxID=134849 RepID=A0A1M7RKG0_9ACTN|nr:hypothetical protein [Cryptosporangium aurantiacum]SHN46649.1 mycothiol synthase [Cryptosporangium aurantiacum]
MIEHSWRDEIPDAEAAEVRELLAVCAKADAEAGFNRPEPPCGGSRHLLVRLLPDERWGGHRSGVRRLAAYLQVRGREAAYVVHPDLRSRGLTTLLVEQHALDDVPGCTIWARNNHPAAARLAQRFGVRAARREWQLLAPLHSAEPPPGLRPATPADDLTTLWSEGSPPTTATALVAPAGRGLDGSAARDAAPGTPAPGGPASGGSAASAGAPRGAVWFDAAAREATEYGPAGRIHAVRGGPVRPLLTAAMAALHDAGLRVAVLTIPSTESELVHEARTLGFRHDQTDVQYLIP